jgi:lysocardiolipin and lysophospholipid acyltransferase
MVTRSPLYAIPSPLRPKLPYSSYFSAFCFFITFNLAIIFISLLQLIVYPLSSKCLPLTSHSIYKRIIQTTKSNFGLTTIWISQYFGPTEFIVTAGEGVKHDWIRKNNLGVFQRLELPERGVWVSFIIAQVGERRSFLVTLCAHHSGR